MNYKNPKNSGQKKGKSFNDLLVGSYKFVHIGFDNCYKDIATVHLHLILLLKPSSTSKNHINNDMIFKRWEKATKSYDVYIHNQDINNTPTDFINRIAYGLKTLKFSSIKKHPEKLIPITEQLHGKHTVSFGKLIKEGRAESDVDYKKSKESK